MGGPGSSRWGTTVTRVLADGLLRLDVRVLAREGALKPGVTSTVTWGSGASLTITVPTDDAECVHLEYEVQTPPNMVIPIRERIRLTRTPCTFGGNRIWFACPGCGDRCAVLYAVKGGFQCRKCHCVAYASTRARA
jgi:hypothetical protein